ncbi:uncharacterized protein LOC105907853 [Clupea harengus]|uniref:Uncharacterized protein LOC105907853 n=1 Tax=Clupea harengus TaxID=7950 RepID=A0A6P8FMS6_CLUHA|nr:uncharacterized protein LOC105907853 [Clupea harengus]
MKGLLGSFFILVCITQGVVTGSVVSQPDQVIISSLGETVTVKCMAQKDSFSNKYIFWYQQKLGQMPRCICMARTYSDLNYFGEFKDSHISCQTTEGGFYLKLRNSTWSDEASYYCAIGNRSHFMDFAEGTFIRIIDETEQNSNVVTVIQSPTQDPVHSVDSDPLQCPGVSETRTEELSLYWFGPASRDSHPGLIYAYRNSSSTCETRSMLKCMHELATSNDSNAATFYCDVKTCGQILLGNGTTVETKGSVAHMIPVLGGTLCLCVVLDIYLIYSYYKNRTCLNCQGRLSKPVRPNTHMGREASDQKCDEGLNYAALHFSQRATPEGRQRREPPQQSVYSDVRGPR